MGWGVGFGLDSLFRPGVDEGDELGKDLGVELGRDGAEVQGVDERRLRAVAVRRPRAVVVSCVERLLHSRKRRCVLCRVRGVAYGTTTPLQPCV